MEDEGVVGEQQLHTPRIPPSRPAPSRPPPPRPTPPGSAPSSPAPARPQPQGPKVSCVEFRANLKCKYTSCRCYGLL